MGSQAPVRVFIGSGEASRLERKTLIHSLRKNSRRELDIYVLNGTHNAYERNDEPPVLTSLPLELKYRSVTEFSLYRFLIPEICGYEGRAIYVDSDMICLGDIGELFDTPMDGADLLATPGYAEHEWATSVLLLDCSRCRFDLEKIYQEIDGGLYSYSDFSRLNPIYLKYHPLRVAKLDPNWNVFDRYDDQTKLVHYTDLMTQPWKFPNHPYGELWFQYFHEAQEVGLITGQDIDLSILRAYTRPDIRQGNSPYQSNQPQQVSWWGQVRRRLAG